VASSGLEQFPPRWIDYLGVVPIAMGIARARVWFRPPSPQSEVGLGPQSARTSFLLALSQSADNLAVFASLYADARRALEPAIFLTNGVCSVALCGGTAWLATHPRLEGPLRRLSQRLLPLLLIAVGCHLLLDASTDEPDLAPQRAAPAAVSELLGPPRVQLLVHAKESLDAEARCAHARCPHPGAARGRAFGSLRDV
jgi:cadmium resistance protein CadD (predicted permease)